MRRVFTLLFLLCLAVPVGVGISGCGKAAPATLCPGYSEGGPIVGQAQNIALTPQYTGISLQFAQSATLATPTATDCQGGSVSIAHYTYSVPEAAPSYTANSTAFTPGILDINPTTGQICAGLWNRNSPGGTPDYSTCMPTGLSGIAQVVASGAGATSNKVLVYVHPIITDIEIGAASTDCISDPATNCPQYAAGLPVPATVTDTYVPNDCLSFGQSAQIVLRLYKGPRSASLPDPNNITYIGGLPTFATQTAALGTFDNNNRGIFTAAAPGSTVVTATLGPGAGTITSNAGFVSVCPPASITVSTPNSVNNAVTVNPTNNEAITAVVFDTKGVRVTGLNLTYVSTSPISVPASSTGIVPIFAGGSNITAICLPPSCNPAPLEQIGRYPNGTPNGNGKPVISNNIVDTTPGTTSSLIWAASTDSFYLLPLDLTANAVPAPTKLPFQPNSLVLTQDGSSIFLGSTSGFMTYATATNSVTRVDTTIQGPVLSPSPNSAQVVATDPVRKLVYIYTPSSSAIVSSFAGVGTRAAWSPDGSTAYIITADNHLLVYSTETSWHSYDLSALNTLNDVISAIPEVGAFIGATASIDGRSYCPNVLTAVTDFYPEASNTAVAQAIIDRLAATNDGKHLLDVRLGTANGTPVMNDLLLGNGAGLPVQSCPLNGSTPPFVTTVSTAPLTGLTAASVTGVVPASDSSIAFVTNTPATGATATAAVLAGYRPTTTGAGTPVTVRLAAGATAAVSGSISSDNKTFFAGTTGDNKLHFITVSTLSDTSQITPNLPSVSVPGSSAVPNLLVSRPRTSLNGQ